MKTIISSLVLLCSWVIITGFHSVKPNDGFDPTLCLEIDGKIEFEEDEHREECKITLLCNDEIQDCVLLKKGRKRFKLVLKKNQFYSIKISKRGYIDKTICVDTQIPFESEDEDLTGLYRFKFLAKLLKESEIDNLNKSVIDLPVALISFNGKKECFYYDKEYTSTIKKEMRKRENEK